MGFDADGRELIVVAIKATFAIPGGGEEPMLLDEQVPLVESDEFAGEPGLSAPVYEVDYAHRKVACDVLVHAYAHAPDGGRVTRLPVGIRVGGMTKTFDVVGERVWERGAFGVAPGAPAPFDVLPISYERAFGGVDASAGDPQNVRTFAPNPVGRGFAHFKERVHGRPLPNTEERGRRVEDPAGAYRPMALGPIGRNWHPRAKLAGTYDQAWIERRAPFWPDDFDYRYFQSAPEDQQIPFPQGGEEVVLRNLTPGGHLGFVLPELRMPVFFFLHDGSEQRLTPVVDTLVIEPELGRFTMTWRTSLPMRRSCFDVRRIIAGELPDRWQRERRVRGKPFYRNLEELARARRGGRH